MSLTIREFRDDDLPACVKVHNTLYEDFATTEEMHVHERNTQPAMMDTVERVGELDGEAVAFAVCLRAIWFGEADRGFVQCLVDPRFSGTEIEREFFRENVQFAFDRGYARVYSPCADKHPDHMKTIEDAGFTFSMRFPVTAVDVRSFDFAPYAPTVRKLESEGIAVRSLESIAFEGGDWVRRFHELHCDVIPDVPHPETANPMPWEVFDEFVRDPKRYSLAGKFVAMDGGRMIGVSEIQANVADPTIGNTMLTAVRREYRRRGIASAMKATALQWAKDRGMRKVLTDNEEKNPMLDLNKQLGFREIFAWRQYYKDK